MKWLTDMHWSLLRGVFLSIILLATAFTAFSINDVNAQQKLVKAESFAFEKTTIIEFENQQGGSEIETIRIWLGSDFTFKSFKTEKDWTGKKTPQGVIVFTTTNPIKSEESVKFGIKTDKEKPGINWKALDSNDKQIEIGKTLVSKSPTPQDAFKDSTTETESAIFTESVFRLIPEKPNVGSTVRVTGDKFASNQDYEFYINNKKLESFQTDENGHFMITTKIPENEKPGRINLFVKDKMGNEKTVSLRLGESGNRMTPEEDIPLTISGLRSIFHRGDFVKLSGTASPGGTVTATIRNPDGELLTTNATQVEINGDWFYETLIPFDSPFGKYSAVITDGNESILRSWIIESSKTIEITPIQLKYEPGQIIIFNGTALPNQKLEVILESPQGIEIFSDILELDQTGFFEIEIPTELSSFEGTYVLTAFQGEQSEIVLVGLGELPEAQLVAKMDKLNYQAGDTAILALHGPPSLPVTLLVFNPSDNEQFSDSITLGPDGKKDYQLDLTGYGSGVYTTVIKRGNAQTADVFTVGLQTGSGPIDILTTRDTYEPGDPILVLGNSGSNILVIVSLINPEGETVKAKETFTNKDGQLTESSFRVPSNAQPGVWIIHAKSGANFKEVSFDVIIAMEEGMQVSFEGIETLPTFGKVVNIKVLGAKQSVVITILSETEEVVGELSLQATGAGAILTPWPVPKDVGPGKYTIKVLDAFDNSAETTFVLK